MNITQKDMARRLGLSVSLVSRALRGEAEKIGATPETVRRIQAEAARCGYHLNVVARSLRCGRTRMLGVVVKDFSDPFFGAITGALQGLAASADYFLLVTGGGADGRLPDLRPLQRYRPDGYILVGSDFLPQGLDEVTRQGAVVVRMGDGRKHERIAQVSVAQADGFRQMIAYLRRQGHARIGYLGDETATSVRRESLLRSAMRAAGLVVQPSWFVRVDDWTPASMRAAWRAWRATGRGVRRPTVIVAADDVVALTLLRALHDAGVAVPRELCVMGVDDIPFAHLAVPALTTLRQPVAEMAAQAFRLVTGPARPAAGARHIELRPELVIRESCGRPVEKTVRR